MSGKEHEEIVVCLENIESEIGSLGFIAIFLFFIMLSTCSIERSLETIAGSVSDSQVEETQGSRK